MRPETLREVALRSNEAACDFGPALAELLDEFYLDGDDSVARQARIDPRPEPTPFPTVNAWLGATAEHLAQRWGLKVPTWTGEEPFLGGPEPSFHPERLSVRGILLVESPPAFRRRNIFVRAEPLMRARFPVDRKAVLPWDEPGRGYLAPVSRPR